MRRGTGEVRTRTVENHYLAPSGAADTHFPAARESARGAHDRFVGADRALIPCGSWSPWSWVSIFPNARTCPVRGSSSGQPTRTDLSFRWGLGG